MSKTTPSTQKPKFKEGEKLLCYHGPLLYEAKCVKIKADDSSNYKYFVHYQGWNKNWDEWVNDTRILKIVTENLELKEKLLKDHTASVREKKKANKATGGAPGTPFQKEGGKKSGGGSANTSRASTPVSERSFKITGSSGKRLLGDDERSTSSVEQEPTTRFNKRTRLSESMLLEDVDTWKFRIVIPEELKYVLISDNNLVCTKKSLFGLPAKTSVSTILNEYSKHAEKSQFENSMAINEVMAGLKDLFDATVGSHLLYRLEKTQYNEKVIDNNLLPSQIYGSAHLLRLMVQIGPLLNRSNIDTSTVANVTFIENIICDFLLYLEKNTGRLFASKNYTEKGESYEESSADSNSGLGKE